ncbi:hypothetical protein [Nostoc sp.]|uniref:hypothetical protein n=1 Tax=Nostoc sp. TaxID=1180 RepID=UPI002FF4E0FD
MSHKIQSTEIFKAIETVTDHLTNKRVITEIAIADPTLVFFLSCDRRSYSGISP